MGSFLPGLFARRERCWGYLSRLSYGADYNTNITFGPCPGSSYPHPAIGTALGTAMHHRLELEVAQMPISDIRIKTRTRKHKAAPSLIPPEARSGSQSAPELRTRIETPGGVILSP